MTGLGAAAVVPRLRGTLGRPYRFVAECDSTQELVRAGDPPEGAVVVTDHQRAGRGRSGRTWEDEPGDALLLSLALRPPATPVLPQLSLVVALAVAEAIERVAGVPAGIKWPNDVELDGTKVAGVLLEGSGGVVACGIGVNVNQDASQLPAGTRRAAGSLRTATGRAHDRAGLLVELLDAVETRYRAWYADGLETLLPALEARSTLTGRAVAVGGERGAVTGLAPDGRLRVVLEDGRVRDVESGEIEPIASGRA